jgi:hypothetical protein
MSESLCSNWRGEWRLIMREIGRRRGKSKDTHSKLFFIVMKLLREPGKFINYLNAVVPRPPLGLKPPLSANSFLTI